MHFAKEFDDPDDPVRIAENMKLVKDQDKYVEYIRHVESKYDSLLPYLTAISAGLINASSCFYFCSDAKRLKLRSEIEEMNALAAAGQQTNSRYIDLTYIDAENEEE